MKRAQNKNYYLASRKFAFTISRLCFILAIFPIPIGVAWRLFSCSMGSVSQCGITSRNADWSVAILSIVFFIIVGVIAFAYGFATYKYAEPERIQKSEQQRRSELYIRTGKILGFLSIIAIPSFPLTMGPLCTINFFGQCDWLGLRYLFYTVCSAIILGILAIAFIINGRNISKQRK